MKFTVVLDSSRENYKEWVKKVMSHEACGVQKGDLMDIVKNVQEILWELEDHNDKSLAIDAIQEIFEGVQL